MRLPFIGISILLVINLLVDAYLYAISTKRSLSKTPRRLQLVSAVCLYVMLGFIVLMPYRKGDNSVVITTMWMLYTYLSIYVAKYIFVIFDLLASVPCLFKHARLRWLTRSGVVAAVATFIIMWWGALVNRFNIDVTHTDVTIADLPEQLDGFKIVQISDLHLGTFGNDTSFVSTLVDSINTCNADIVVFTGDIVNRKADELQPFVNVLSRIKSRYGVYSILGNHDYGDYVAWDDPQQKVDNLDSLISLQRRMGWDLLRNATDTLTLGPDTLMLIGVENIGDPPFHVYGNLSEAYATPGDKHTKILFSHNPSHWVSEIKDRQDKNIALTLSGHTHAMQVTIGDWSPCVFRYKEWGGDYVDAFGRHLYVNIGDGTVGMPARIGATPEISVITLCK